MGVEEKIKDILEQYKSETMDSIWTTTKKVVEDVKVHLKQITAQMSNFDVHDEEHSEKVLDIIENLLGEGIEKLSFYELLLIYITALPVWEYTLIKAIEGTEEIYDNTLEVKILNDFKPVHKVEEAIKIVRDNKDKLYTSYENIKEYIFLENTEKDLIENLASLICEYEEYRNGYVEELNKLKGNVAKYLSYSNMIRCEFIRLTHHKRITRYIKGIKRKYINLIGNYPTEKLIDDICCICRGHGEEISYVFQLSTKSAITEEMKGNVQFVAILLRLGDVIHFSADRAPLSLFAEKNITDEISLKHWKAKFQELKYTFYVHNDRTYIKFSAFCTSPSIYYFIQDYMNWIDNEISNYYSLKQKWQYDRMDNIENYILNIGDKVDRKEIVSDKSIFIPSNKMKFTLEQSKILELLMGVQLYKDKYLCLREIYQNALDATKCMMAYNNVRGINEVTFIEFGMGEDYIDDDFHKYIYCLDHGTGMNEYIIENFLLHIGNSYYKSREFKKRNVEWKQSVNPTSQFGIGLLAGYMIADKIGITTKYHQSGSKLISFVLEGLNEHCYYTKPGKIEEEKIGMHGTIIKLYLKQEEALKITNEYIEKMPLLLMSNRDEFIKQYIDINVYKNNLMFLLCRNIGIEHKDIPVYIVDTEGEKRRLISGCEIFNYMNYPQIEKNEVVKLYSDYPYHKDDIEKYTQLVEAREKVKDYVIEVTTESLQVVSHISLPMKGIQDVSLDKYRYSEFIGRREGSILVDGIIISENTYNIRQGLKEILSQDIIRNSILNFIGNKRPILSIDRNSIISIPKIEDELNIIQQKFIEKIVECIVEHIRDNEIDINSIEMSAILEIIAKVFPTIYISILRKLCSTKISEAIIAKEVWNSNEKKLREIINGEELEITNTNFSEYTENTRRIILGKALGASQVVVDGYQVKLIGSEFIEFPFAKYHHYNEGISLSSVVIKADKWKGIFSEYDLVSSIWPIVSGNLYDALELDYEIKEIIEGRSKTISDSSNAIQAIAQLDPVMINPKVGIGQEERNIKKLECKVGEFGRIAKEFWLFELNNMGQMGRNQNKDYVLYAYIAPRKLNYKEEERLKEIEDYDQDYVKGVREGWSILFMGKISQYVILPGLCTREEIIKAIPQSYLELEKNVTYYNTDGTKVVK